MKLVLIIIAKDYGDIMIGVTIITCTHLPQYRENIFENYRRQRFKDKELIIVLNSNTLDCDKWQKYSLEYQSVKVLLLPEMSVGSCMNYAADRAGFDYIANFDHDDYYGAEYLNDFMNVAPHLDAGLFGKKTHYVYLEEDGTLALMYPGNENRFVDYIDGPTMFIRKTVFDKVRFIDDNISDCRFSWDCRDKGIRIFSVNRRHFTYVRRKDQSLHTWKIDNRELISSYCSVVTKIANFRPYVDYR